MPWGISDEEMDQALQDLFGSATDSNGTQAAADQLGPTPSEPGITAGILSDVPAHLQVPPTDWSSMDLGLSGTDGASLASGSPHYHLGGSGSGGFSPAPNIAPMGYPGPQNATQVSAALQSSPVNLNGAHPPRPSGGGVATPPSVEQIAQSAPFNMTRQNLTDTRSYSDQQMNDRAAIRGAVGALGDWAVPEKAIPKYAKRIVSGAIDALNGNLDLLDEQGREQAYQDELMRIMRNRMNQSLVGQNVPPMLRGFGMK